MPVCDNGLEAAEINDPALQRYFALFSEFVENEEALRMATEAKEASSEGVRKYAPYLVEGFTPTQREEVVKMFMYLVNDSLQAIQEATGKGEGFGVGDVRHLIQADLQDAVQDLRDELAFAEEEEADHLEAQIEEHGRILDNFEHFFQEALDRFEGLGMERKDGRLYPTFQEAQGQNWDDNKRFSTSSKETASTHLKSVFSFIPEVDFLRNPEGDVVRKGGDGEPILQPRTNYLGYNSYMDMTEAWNKAAYLLTDVFPRTPENMLQTLREKGEHDPMALALYKTLVTKSDETLQSLSNALGKHYATFKLIWGRKGDEGMQLQPIDQDRLSRGRALLEDWKSGFFGSNLTVQGSDGEPRLNTEMVQNIRERFLQRVEEQDIQSDEFRQTVYEAFRFMGMEMPKDYLRAAQEGEAEFGRGWNAEFATKSDKVGFSNSSLMGRLFDALMSQGEEDVSAHSVNPVEHERTAVVLKKMSNAAAEYTKDVYAPSSTTAEGNRVHAVQDHEPLTRTFSQLQSPEEVRKLLRDPFMANSFLARILGQTGIRGDEYTGAQQQRYELLTQALDFDYVGGLSIQGRRQGKSRDSLSSVDRDIHQMSFFQNGGHNTRIVMGPTLSDKERSYAIKIPNLKVLARGSSLEGRPNADDLWEVSIEIEDGDLSIDSTEDVALDRLLYHSALSEIQRVVRMNQWLDENSRSNHKLGAHYTQAAQLFYLFPELNYHRIEDADLRDQIYDTTGDTPRIINPEQSDSAREAIMQVLHAKLEQDAIETYSEWRRRDIEDHMNKQYLSDQTPYDPTSQEARIFAAFDMTVTDKIMMPELHRLFHGDPAQFFKGPMAFTEEGDPTSILDRPAEAQNLIDTTLGNMEKRLAKEMAPAMTSGMDEDATFVQATIQDRFLESELLDTYQEILEGHGAAYGDVEATDAQELTTLEEHLKVALAYGEISQASHDEAMDQIREGGDYRIDEETMEKLLTMTHKGIYVGRRWDEELGQYVEIYTKISSIPLIPNITANTELDKLRKAMETGDTDRVVYESGQKLGKVSPAQIFNEDGTVKEIEELGQELAPANQELKRKDFGLQFRIPKKNDDIALSTQANKLFLADALGIEGFQIPGEKESYTGRELFSEKERVREEMMELRKQQLFEDLDATVHESGKVTVDPDRLKELILDEAEERDWSQALMERIERFAAEDMEVPLSFSGASTRIESLLLSLIEKRIIKERMHGRSYAQATSAGMLWQNALDTGDIVFTEDFDPTTGLSFVDVDADGNVQPAQIVVPWHFKDQDGNVIDMEQYTKTLPGGRTVLDEEKMDPEVRKAITHRIPYQGPNSHLPVEIVGFMPPNLWSMAFVPPEITVQMGSDFDVDKLNAYLTRYTFREDDGALVKIGEGASREHQLQQRYADIMWAGATNPEALHRNLLPLDQTDLHDEIDALGDSAREFEYNHPLYRNRAMDSQQAGNQLIGMTSLWAQLEALLQRDPMELDYLTKAARKQGDLGIEIRKSTGANMNMTQVGGAPTVHSGHSDAPLTAHVAIKLFQNAAVDNAKENVLGPLGVTMDNIGVAMTLLMMSDGQGNGVDLEHVTRLLNQPIIKSVMERVQRKQSMFENVSSREAMNEAIAEVIENLDAPLPGEGNGRLDDPETMLGHIKNPTPESRNYQEAQASYLQVFKDLHRYANGFDVVRSAYLFGDRQGAGSTMIEALQHQRALYEKMDNQPFKNPHAIGDGEQGAAAKNSFVLASEMYDDLFAYQSDSFQRLWAEVEHLQDRDLTPDELKQAFQDFRAFTVLSTRGEDLKELRERFLFGEAYVGDRIPIDISFTEGMAERAQEGETYQIAYPEGTARQFPLEDGQTGVTFAGEQRVLVTREGLREDDGKVVFTVEPTDAQPDLATRIIEARAEGWGKDHLFLRLMNPTPPRVEEEAVIDGEKRPVLSPAEINFRSIKMEKTDQPRIIQDIAQMLASEDSKRRNLARDLMLYQLYARGWRRGPRDFGDLVPTAFLDEIGVIDELAGHNIYDEPWSPHRFVRQFLQHNPMKARVLSDEELVSLPGNNDRLPSQFTQDPDTFPPSLRDAEGESYSYISYFDSTLGRWRLYEENKGQYAEIDVLGDATKRANGNLEYDPTTEVPKSSFVPQAGVSNVKRAGSKAQRTPINQPKSTPTSKKEKDISTWRRYIQGGESIQSVVERIAQDDNIDGSLQQVARTLAPILDSKSGPIPVETNRGLGGSAQFHQGTIYFNPQKGQGHEFAARQLLHEALHAVSVDRYNVYRAIQEGDRSREEAGMSKREYQAFQQIEKLYSLGREVLIDEVGRETFNEGVDKIREVIDGKRLEATLNSTERNLIYPLSMKTEFIAQVITNQEFQEWANGVKAGRNKNLFERIAGAFRALVQALSSALGIEVQQESLLGRGIEETMTLMQQRLARKKRSKKSKPPSQSRRSNTRAHEVSLKGKTWKILVQPSGTIEVYSEHGTEIKGGDIRRQVIAKFKAQQEATQKQKRKEEADEEVQERGNVDPSSAPSPDPTPDIQALMEKRKKEFQNKNNSFDVEGLGMSVGEFLNTLSPDERATFRELRNNIITRC